jgi:hypothetical protein
MNLVQKTKFSLLCCGLIFLNACNIVNPRLERFSTENKPQVGELTFSESKDETLYFKVLALGEANQTRVDVFTHMSTSRKPISADKITAQAHLPNGEQKALALRKQDGEGNHFVGVIPGVDKGQYRVTIKIKLSKEYEQSQTILFAR